MSTAEKSGESSSLSSAKIAIISASAVVIAILIFVAYVIRLRTAANRADGE